MTTPSKAVNMDEAVERLEPCPFCGGRPEIAMSEIPVERAVRIRCAAGCCERVGRDDRPWAHNSEMIATDRAVALWNTRASNARAEAAEEALRELEAACDRVAAGRSQAAYIQMLDDGQQADLLGLDEARRRARTTLASMKEKPGAA